MMIEKNGLMFLHSRIFQENFSLTGKSHVLFLELSIPQYSIQKTRSLEMETENRRFLITVEQAAYKHRRDASQKCLEPITDQVLFSNIAQP